ncbi:SRA stem-loop-interacting RNA-binding protein, mitochondrial [Carettochelys insculpta]|uniref:SRA stem-loop-interacting RNA-binding protein, mitochondrial n=1 Tax=Carettochelys insculpta TaxID=44489 RepID=UPI003EB783AF
MAAAAAAVARGLAPRLFEIFVYRVHWTLAPKDIREYFSQFGTIRRCTLPFDKNTGFHKGFCFVGFTSEEGLNNALQKESHVIDGFKLQVQQQQLRSSPSQYGNEGAADVS